MSMKVNGGYNNSVARYAEEAIRNKETEKNAEKSQSAEKAGGKEEPAKAAQPQDEYISSEQSGAKPTGLYRVGQDEEGKRKIFYDDPKKAGNEDGKEQPRVNGRNPEEEDEEWVANTDKVDREIRKLKEKKSQIERQLRSASGDEEKTGELEKKLTQVENELKQKDNDAYRRQQAKVSRKN